MTSTTFRTCVPAAAVLAVLLIPVSASAAPSDDTRVARQWAQRLQDDARVLRNGTRTGATLPVLLRERDRLSADIENLVGSYTQWVATLNSGQRARVETPLAEMHKGCEQIRQHLAELASVLGAPQMDRERAQKLGRAIGRQALTCARNLRRAERGARTASPGER